MTTQLTARVFAEGFCFGEGPRWRASHLWFSDMHDHKVIKLDATGQAETIVDVPNRPSGLGWMPNGDLLVVSMTDKRILRFDGHQLTIHADLHDLASGSCNDMVVDASGRAYVGNFGADQNNGAGQVAEIIAVEANGTARVVARDLVFPNGTVITPDGRTLIVGETFASRLTAFDIDAHGELANRRVWAELPKPNILSLRRSRAVPDGICLDALGGIWVASPTTNECIRLCEGGTVTHRVTTDRGAYACMLGGQRLYILTCKSSRHAQCQAERSGQVVVADAPAPGAGLP